MSNVLSLSYGKDSLACLGACDELGIKIDRIIHAEIWATDDIPADLPPMVEFKKKADKIIKERWGLEVEHICATWGGEKRQHTKRKSIKLNSEGNLAEPSMGSRWCEADGVKNLKLTYSNLFYRRRQKVKGTGKWEAGMIWGFPMQKGNWCTSMLKTAALKKNKSSSDMTILGIAADEPERIERHRKKPNIMLPLVDIGWDEATCRKWCEDNDLLSPIYTTETRGGCWFCHCQRIDSLRRLRKNYPELWALLLKWDTDSPVSWAPNGITVHDYDTRFQMEDEGIDMTGFRWAWIKNGIGGQYTFEALLKRKEENNET